MEKVTVYTKDYCPYCVAAKNLLKQRGIAFTEIEITASNLEEFEALKKKTGMRTVPQIFHGDTLIGGYDSLAKRDSEDQLQFLK